MSLDSTVDSLKPTLARKAESGQHHSLWLLLIIVMVGATVRIHCLGELSLWFDESFCWKMSTFPFSEQWARPAQDNHPPLYYFFLKAWTLLWGDSPETIRLLSVVFGLLTIVGAFALVRETEALVFNCAIDDRRATNPALLAASLVALSPFQIEWSQTVRMYAPGATLAVWSTWAMLRALYTPSVRWTNWLLYVALAAGLIYTHYFGFFVLAAQGCYCAIRSIRSFCKPDGHGPAGWRAVIYPVLAVAAIAALWWPWLGEFLIQRQRGVEQEWGRPTGVDHLVRSVAEMFGLMWAPPAQELTRAWIIIGLFSACSIAATICGRKAERLLGLIVVCSFGLALTFSSGSKSLIASWYFLFAHALFLCVIAVWTSRLFRGTPRAVVTGIVLASAAWQCWQQVQWRESRAKLPSFQGAMAYVESVREPDEPIFVNGPRDLVAASPYVEHPGTLFVLSPRRDFRFGEGTAVLIPQEYASFESVAAIQTKRAWVVFATNGSANPLAVDMPAEWVDVSEERFADWRYGQIVVRQYERRDALRQLLKSKATADARKADAL